MKRGGICLLGLAAALAVGVTLVGTTQNNVLAMGGFLAVLVVTARAAKIV